MIWGKNSAEGRRGICLKLGLAITGSLRVPEQTQPCRLSGFGSTEGHSFSAAQKWILLTSFLDSKWIVFYLFSCCGRRGFGTPKAKKIRGLGLVSSPRQGRWCQSAWWEFWPRKSQASREDRRSKNLVLQRTAPVISGVSMML